MGHRVVKRVPMDFDAPLNEVWQGYRSPEWRPCPSNDCDNGQKLAAGLIEHLAHLLLIAAEAPDKGTLHPWLTEAGVRHVPKENIREVTDVLAGRPYRRPFGHDAIDRWHASKAIIQAAGLPEDWHLCPVCEGHNIHPDDIEASEAWESTEPPEGDGWQLWETTSEGSPQTPVCSTPEALAKYCAVHCSPFAGFKWTQDEWLASITGGTTGVDTLLVARVPG